MCCHFVCLFEITCVHKIITRRATFNFFWRCPENVLVRKAIYLKNIVGRDYLSTRRDIKRKAFFSALRFRLYKARVLDLWFKTYDGETKTTRTQHTPTAHICTLEGYYKLHAADYDTRLMMVLAVVAVPSRFRDALLLKNRDAIYYYDTSITAM